MEVKYRKNAAHGDGLVAITPKKLGQMRFAAKLYAHAKSLKESDLCLGVISMTSEPAVVERVILVE